MSIDPQSSYSPRGPTDFRASGVPDVTVPRPPASGAKWVMILAALVVGVPAAAGAAYALADVAKGWVWIAGLVIGGIAGPLWLVVSALRLLSAMGRRDLYTLRYRRPQFAAPAVITCLLAAWAVVGGMYQCTSVYIDNYCGQNVTLELDGQPWLTAGDNSTHEMRVLRKTHTIDVRSGDGKPLDRQTVNVDSGGPYIFNVLAAMNYTHGVAHYSTVNLPFGNGDTLTPIDHQVWIKANVDYLFEDAPTSITVDEGSSTDRTFLIRNPEAKGEKAPKGPEAEHP